MIKLLTSAQLSRYNRRKDRSVTIAFETNEKSSEEIAQIDSMLDCFGYLYFKGEQRLTDKEIEEIDKLKTSLFKKNKSQSKRLRDVLWLVWHQDGEKGNFDDFYKNETERIIKHYQNKLEE